MIIHNPILTGSFTVNGTDVASITSSAASITAINSYTASQNILNGTYATTGSNTFKNPQTINSNLVVTGSITAQTLVVQTVSSSVIYSSGSNVFGNNIANTQTFTGSMLVTGSVTATEGNFLGSGVDGSLGSVVRISTTNTNGNARNWALVNTFDSYGDLNFRVSTAQGGNALVSGSTILTLSRTGNVGIGVNPYSNTALAVKGTYGLWIERGSTNDSGVGLYHDGTNAIIYSSYQTTGAFGGLALYTSNLQRLTITSAGNVGIGTSSPLNVLDVRAASATMGNYQTIQAFSTDSAAINLGGGISLGGYFTGTTSIAQFGSIVGRKENGTSGNYDGYLAFGTNAQATGVVERMRITSGGDISIGTTSTNSNTKVKIKASSEGSAIGLSSSTLCIARSATDTFLSIGYYSTPDAFLLSTSYGADGAYKPLAFATSDTERMRITNTGKITYGAGTYFTTNYSGGFVFNSSTDAYNNFIASDNGNATLRGALTQNASDERLKNNIQIIPNAIEKISQLKGVTFEWNKEIYETSRTTDIGVIAQDVQKVLPDAVTLAPFDTNIENNTSKSGENYLTVYYEKLIPLLIEGIKELQAQITELKNK